MARQVLVNQDNVELEGVVYDTGAVVKVSDETFADLTAADRFTDGTLTDQGLVPDDESDEVYDQVAAPAVTSTDAVGANPTKAEFDALRADLLALRTALTGAGRPLA